MKKPAFHHIRYTLALPATIGFGGTPTRSRPLDQGNQSMFKIVFGENIAPRNHPS
jgi:hypothetical protein